MTQKSANRAACEALLTLIFNFLPFVNSKRYGAVVEEKTSNHDFHKTQRPKRGNWWAEQKTSLPKHGMQFKTEKQLCLSGLSVVSGESTQEEILKTKRKWCTNKCPHIAMYVFFVCIAIVFESTTHYMLLILHKIEH